MGNNGNGHICPTCNTRLTPVKLYAPEILRIFKGGYTEYSKNGILTNYKVCLLSTCKAGYANRLAYERIIEEGMIRTEERAILVEE